MRLHPSLFATWLRPVAVVLLAVLTLTSSRTHLLAQDDKPKEIAKPVVVFNLASIDKVLGHANFLFKEIERPELIDFLGAGLANIRDFKGVERTKSGGLMIFLADGIFPTPVPVAYVPVSDIKEFEQTLATTPLKLQKSEDGEDRYELEPRNGQKLAVRLVNGYAMIAQNQEQLDRNFIDPAEFTASLSNRYDLAVSANLKVVSAPVKQLLNNMLRSSTQATMQQRDNEPDGAYQLRKSQAEGNLHFFESILLDGEELTIGAKLEQDNKKAFLEAVVRAKPDTAFAKELTGEIKPSYFWSVIDHNVPLSVSLAGPFNDFQKKQFAQMLKVGEQEANRGLAKLPADTKVDEIPKLDSVRLLFESVKATVDAGYFDGFVQFYGDPKDDFVIVGGVKLVEGKKFFTGISDILSRSKEAFPKELELEMSALSHGDAVFHRLTPEKIDANNALVYGEKPSFFFGADNNAAWFAFGGKNAVTKLRDTMDKVEESKQHAPKADNLVPFELVMNLSHWTEQRANKGKPGPFNELAKKSFTQPGSDTLRMDTRPVENGFRMRIQVEHGFLKLLGNGIAKQIDGKNNF